MTHKPKRVALWLIVGWSVAMLAASLFRGPRGVALADPIFTPAVLISLAISAATTAASVGLDYLLAKKQKVAPVDRGKQDDIRVSIPGYGEPIPWARGLMRNAPVWFDHVEPYDIPVVTQGHSGGKAPHPAPPTPTVTEHQYWTSLFGVFRDCKQRPITNVTRIWFNNDLVWNTVQDQLSATLYEAENATLAGTATATASSIASNAEKVTGIGSGAGNYVEFTIPITSDGDYDIAVIYLDSTSDLQYEVMLDGSHVGFIACPASGSGLTAVQTIGLSMVTGTRTVRFRNTSAAAPDMDRIEIVETVTFTNGQDARVMSGLVDTSMLAPSDETKPWAYYNNHPPEIDTDTNEPIVGTTTITGNISKWGNPTIEINRGTTDQAPHAGLVELRGANASAFRGYATIAINHIQMVSGALPNVTLESDDGIRAITTTITDLYDLGGIDTGTYLDVTALVGDTITGALRTSTKAIGETVRDLQTRFQFDMVEVDGIVKAVKRNRTDIDFTVTVADCRAHPDNSEVPQQDAVITDIDPMQLPFEVDVNYLDPANDYHNMVQFDRQIDGNQFDVQSVSLSLVDNEDNMKKLATVLLHKPEMEGRTFSLELGPKYFPVIPGSVGTLTLTNATHTIRVADGKYDLPVGVSQFQAVRHAASIYTPSGHGSDFSLEIPVGGFPSNTKVIILDAPLLRPEDAGDGQEMVLYVGGCGIGGGKWPGAFAYQEFPIGSGAFGLLIKDLTLSQASGVGVSTTALDDVADPAVWDDTSSLTVNFYYDPGLSTAASNAEVEDNPNLNLLGVENPSTHDVEWVQFKTATPGTASSPFVAQYTLTNFLRGRSFSDFNVGTHTTADNVLVMDSTIKIVRFQYTEIGT